MPERTDCQQRCRFYERHLRGETYEEILDSEGVSRECVRYWCRRQRDGGGCRTVYRRKPAGLLSQFSPLVRYSILCLRLEHPRWGPNRIRARLKKRASLRRIALPSEASIGRYLHQWPRFRRRSKERPRRKRPREATEVHQRWEIDFKVGIALEDGTLANLLTVCDPVGEACLGACVFPAGKVGQKAKRVKFPQLRGGLRTSFALWGTLPDEIQTDGETVFIGQPQDSFPSLFTLWLVGLNIDHLVIRSGMPTDNAEVERGHRTVNDYAIVGNEDAHITQLQHILDEAVHELTFELSSRAERCGGLAPIIAHPELLKPRRPFQAKHELALFDLKRVDNYLATFTWERKVGKTGQITIGGHHQRYSVGRAYARQQVLVRFDPTDRHFVFFDANEPDHEIGRRPARNLEVADITGLAEWPAGLGVQQLPLPFFVAEGVSC